MCIRDRAYAVLERELRPGDIVLVKSSNGSGLAALGERLAAAPASGTAASTTDTKEGRA